MGSSGLTLQVLALASLLPLVVCPLIALDAWIWTRRQQRWAIEVTLDLVTLIQKGWIDRARSRLRECPGLLGRHFVHVGLQPGKADSDASSQTVQRMERAVVASLAGHVHLLGLGIAVSAAGALGVLVTISSEGPVLLPVPARVMLMMFCTPFGLLALAPLVAWFCLRCVHVWGTDLCTQLLRLQREVAACLARAPGGSSPSAPTREGNLPAP